MREFCRKGCAVVAAAAIAAAADAAIEMGAPFSDGAVLQCGMEVPVWGKASPGATVKVSFAGAERTASAAGDGRWLVRLPAMEVCRDGREMRVESGGESVTVRDVLVGEVWFAAGQSNMETAIWADHSRYRDENGGLMVEMTRLPLVRYVKVPHAWSTEPAPVAAKWRRFVPGDLKEFTPITISMGSFNVSLSAVAFYYARELHLALGVPVGIVESSWGGTNIDAWTPRSGYDGCDPSIRDAAEYRVRSEWTAADAAGPITGACQQPTVLYNGMVGAFAPMAMRGMIWYQGCHNAGRFAGTYCAKMHALFEGWKREFLNPGLKMYFVQLAPWKQNWVSLVEQQNMFAAEEPNAALAVTSDVGNFWDIHPNRKEIVARRLAVHALKRDYGFDIPEDDSPVLSGVRYADGAAVLEFSHATGLYVYAADGSHDAAFELAGADGVWHPARIVNFRPGTDRHGNKRDSDFIDEPRIVLRSDAVASPSAVRYMARDRTAGTVYNQVSLPLGPFGEDAARKVTRQ